jgi:hypothetical protein
MNIAPSSLETGRWKRYCPSEMLIANYDATTRKTVRIINTGKYSKLKTAEIWLHTHTMGQK